MSKKEIKKMLEIEDNKNIIRIKNKDFSEVFIFDRTNMDEYTKLLFEEFISQNQFLLDKTRLEDILYDYEYATDGWGHDFIKEWSYGGRVYLFITGEELINYKKDKNNKWFSIKPITDFNIKINCNFINGQKWLKKTIKGDDNPYYGRGNSFSIFSLFCKYCLDFKKF